MYDESCLPRIGSNIRLLRGACQFNQQQFAERIGISQTHLSNIEHNNVQVSLKLLVRSARPGTFRGAAVSSTARSAPGAVAFTVAGTAASCERYISNSLQPSITW